jgi:hypothetical protein
MRFEHKPLHFIALDEQRRQFGDAEVLDLGDEALQIGYRGKHADTGGVLYKDRANAFGSFSLNDAVWAAHLIGIDFDRVTLAKRPAYTDWRATPSDNDTFFYDDGVSRTFPPNMLLSPSVRNFGRHSTPLNGVGNHRHQIMTRGWYEWAGITY